MNDGLVWTRRGLRVRNTVLAIAFLVLFNALNTWSTPEECRDVPVREWSDMCKKVMFR